MNEAIEAHAILDAIFEEVRRIGQRVKRIEETQDRQIKTVSANFKLIGSEIHNISQLIKLERNRFDDISDKVNSLQCIKGYTPPELRLAKPGNGQGKY